MISSNLKKGDKVYVTEEFIAECKGKYGDDVDCHAILGTLEIKRVGFGECLVRRIDTGKLLNSIVIPNTALRLVDYRKIFNNLSH